MRPVTKLIGLAVARRVVRPTAAFVLRKNPWGLAAVAAAPIAFEVGLAVWDAMTFDVDAEDGQLDDIEGTLVDDRDDSLR